MTARQYPSNNRSRKGEVSMTLLRGMIMKCYSQDMARKLPVPASENNDRFPILHSHPETLVKPALEYTRIVVKHPDTRSLLTLPHVCVKSNCKQWSVCCYSTTVSPHRLTTDPPPQLKWRAPGLAERSRSGYLFFLLGHVTARWDR